MSSRGRPAWWARLAARSFPQLPSWLPHAVAAGLLATGAALAAARYLEREEAQLRARLSPVAIVVAGRDLDEGAALAAADLAVASLPREALPGGALLPGAIEALEGRRLRVALRTGDPVLRSLVADAGEPPPLARDLTPGSRALAVPIEPAGAVGGFLEPGDRVDVILVWDEAGGESRAVTLLEAMRLLAVGEARRPGVVPREAATAVLEADPGEVEALLLALGRGRLALALRHPDDTGRRVNRRPVTLAPLLPGYRPPSGPAPEVEVIRGPR